VVVEEQAKENLEKLLDEGLMGQDFFTGTPKSQKASVWGKKVLIIKGDIVVPSAKEIIKKWSVD